MYPRLHHQTFSRHAASNCAKISTSIICNIFWNKSKDIKANIHKKLFDVSEIYSIHSFTVYISKLLQKGPKKQYRSFKTQLKTFR